MFYHHVFFWLKPDADRAYFVSQLKQLTQIGLIQESRVGEKVPSEREVVDSTYDYSLFLAFANKADHDAYQVDAEHNGFVENCKNLWTRVQVYDSQNAF
jgi:hypothetical protein